MTDPRDATIDQPGRDNLREPEAVPAADSVAELAGILDGYMAELQAGKAPDRARLLSAHPGLAAQLETCLAGIEFVDRATGPAAEEPAALGDFRIIRELGRGGMGVVYEAEQTSLRRRVALKVLRYGAVADEEAMQRFRREAETIARLHHTNIVPIFAVGSERSVHYYAMQLIAGRSLADVLEESQRTGRPLAAEDVARWGLEAAEALAHAHQRGVIHRDIKPSNLLLDTDGVVWLTDFGLAKRADEATLTVTGTLMGTPRYMSPEQAESLRRPVDHRTDLYSLGASLYELATGQPVFQSATPHGVIAQILTSEPTRPRQARPDIPRDLETIILTCLSKDPSQRYQSARALAEDLRAVLDGRPIRARRAPLPERVVRFVQRRKKAIGSGAIGIAATVLLMLGAVLGWRYYSDWRLGRVELTTVGPPLTARILAGSGAEPIGEPFDFGTHTVLSLPEDDYRIRLTGVGRLGRTYRLGVNRGESHSYRISLDEGLLLEEASIPFAPSTGASPLTPGKADFIHWDGQTLMRRDGATGLPAWDAAEPGKIGVEHHGPSSPLAWMQRLALLQDDSRPGTLVEPPPDLDGDGTGDVVMAFARTPSFLAVSGRDGSMLWTYSAALDGVGGPDPFGPDELARALEATDPAGGGKPRLAIKGGRVIGPPALVQIDDDGVLDFLALFFVFDTPTGSGVEFGIDGGVIHFDKLQPGRRVIAAISGRTGCGLWSRTLDSLTMSRPWLWDRMNRWYPTSVPFDAFDSGLAVVPGREGPIVGLLTDSNWTALDPATGKPRGRPIQIGFKPLRPVQYADLDGDGSPEVLALGLGAKRGSTTLAAYATATSDQLWLETVWGFDFTPGFAGGSSRWPLVDDLDGDGLAEVVVPDAGVLPRFYEYRGVRLLDGATGQARWLHPMRPDYARTDDGVIHVVEAPDLDGDDTRDVVSVSTYLGRDPTMVREGKPPEPPRVYVDALSGKDGCSLWEWHVDLTPSTTTRVGPPCWWGRGPDGWPMLAIPLGGKGPEEDPQTNRADEPPAPVVHVLAVATGREVHAIDGLSWPRAADLDGDGLVDLWGSVQGHLRAFRAEPPDAWRVLGNFNPVGDLDGDGIRDVFTGLLQVPSESDRVQTGGRTAIARSGRDGRVLWETRLDPLDAWLRPRNGASYMLSTALRPDEDLDGDGSPDLLILKTQRGRFGRQGSSALIRALSGRSGRILWSAGLRLPGYEGLGHTDVWAVGIVPRERSGTPDVLILHGGRVGVSRRINRLARLSGSDGRVIWDIPLAEFDAATIADFGGFLRPLTDLDGDGRPDVVIHFQVGADAFERRAISLRDAKVLWSQAIASAPEERSASVIGDLHGDGRAEVIAIDRRLDGPSPGVQFTALDGHDGSTRWTYRPQSLGQTQASKLRDLCLADFEGKRFREVCVTVDLADGRHRGLILDAQGWERSGRDLSGGSPTMTSVDLDGDGRDELLFAEGNRVYATRGDLKELWSRPSPASGRETVGRIIPARAGQQATVVLDSMIGLDGSSGRTRWSGPSARGILDEGGDGGLPRLLGGSDDETSCRIALTTTPEGTFQRAGGEIVRPRPVPDDPRWLRPVPWADSQRHYIPPSMLVGMTGVALLNVILPLAILRMATRRRVWGVRLLMALPVVVAIPMAVFLAIDAMEPVPHDPPLIGGTLVTLAGVPVVVYLSTLGGGLVRRRWRSLARLVLLTILASVAVGALSLWSDMNRMAPIEHYSWTGWHGLAYAGAYAAGVLILLGWTVRGMRRFLRRRRRPVVAATSS